MASVQGQRWETIAIDPTALSEEDYSFFGGLEQLTDYELLDSKEKRLKPKPSLAKTDSTHNVKEVDVTNIEKAAVKKLPESTNNVNAKLEKNIFKKKRSDKLQKNLVQTNVVGMLPKNRIEKKETNKLQKNVRNGLVSLKQELRSRKRRRADGASLNQKSHTVKKRRAPHTTDGSVICASSNYQAKDLIGWASAKLPESAQDCDDNHEDDYKDWENLFVPECVLTNLKDLRYKTPTPIQRAVLPSAINGRKDIIAASQTGSGKTLAFAIPLIRRITEMKERTRDPKALILTPTRELAIQVKNHIAAIIKDSDITACVIVGGMAAQKQSRLLRRRPDIIVATPGRLWDLLVKGENEFLADLYKIRCLVLDEADRLCGDSSHFEDLGHILDYITDRSEDGSFRQTFIFSATMTLIHAPPKRLQLLGAPMMTTQEKIDKLMKKARMGEAPKLIDLTTSNLVAKNLSEFRMLCPSEDKDVYLYFLTFKYPGRTLVFVNSIDSAKRLHGLLQLLGLTSFVIHAHMQQKQRLKNLERFAETPNSVLLASDVAARGLDIRNIEHIIHYHVPKTCEGYIHRSGRTARASEEGISVMLIAPQEAKQYKNICRTLHRTSDLAILTASADLLQGLKKRVDLARQIEAIRHTAAKSKKESNWIQKQAEAMDILLDDDYSESIVKKARIHDSVESKTVAGLMRNLEELLRKPVLSIGSAAKHPLLYLNSI